MAKYKQSEQHDDAYYGTDEEKFKEQPQETVLFEKKYKVKLVQNSKLSLYINGKIYDFEPYKEIEVDRGFIESPDFTVNIRKFLVKEA